MMLLEGVVTGLAIADDEDAVAPLTTAMLAGLGVLR